MKARQTHIAIASEMDVAKAILLSRRLSADLSFSAGDQSRVATVVSELARNIIKYAQRGHVIVSPLEQEGRCGIQIVAEDHGPGIVDIELAMQDHYSSSGTLGLGLPGVRRMMDEFNIESKPGQGTRVTCCQWR